MEEEEEGEKGSGDYVYEAPSLCNLIAPHYNHGHSRNFFPGSHGVKWRPLFFWLGSCRPRSALWSLRIVAPDEAHK